ncbi:bifunctional phosphoribosylaminoimidazolecarboxamide formyltransferase/IMP cyclohydrolase [Thermomicrobium sp.]
MRALLSVADKTGVAVFAQRLLDLGWEVFATGGTARVLREHGMPVREISELTGFPELLQGRVKTLHPAVHAGILARHDRPTDLEQLAEHAIVPIQLVAVNLYPFDRHVTPETPEDVALELIDVGGPALLRAAAKNFPWVLPICDPRDYEPIADKLAQFGITGIDHETRRALAAKAFAHLATYDAQIASYLRTEEFPELLPLPLRKLHTLRYGENPHQRAAIYQILDTTPQVSRWQVVGEAALSYNNVLDAVAAWQLVQRFTQPAAVIVKHAAPCGVAVAATPHEAFLRAFEADPVSSFGGIVALNRTLDAEAALAVTQHFFDLLIVPDKQPGVETLLARRKSLRLIIAPPWTDPGLVFRSVGDAVLIQSADRPLRLPETWQVVTSRQPTETEWHDLAFAWTVVPFVLSNGVVIARHAQTVGIGGGQPNRVDAVRLALWRAGDRARHAVLASDAFFPFPDSVELAAAAGITAIVQPGGSKRDREVVEAAERAGIAMVFTGERHFRH